MRELQGITWCAFLPHIQLHVLLLAVCGNKCRLRALQFSVSHILWCGVLHVHVVRGSVLVVMSSSLPTVVPLTTGHVRRVMEKIKDFNELCYLLNIPEDKRGSAACAAEHYVHHSTQPRRVRWMIYTLDYYMGEPGLADSVIECAETPAGVCVSSDGMYMYMYVVDCISEKELHVYTHM